MKGREGTGKGSVYKGFDGMRDGKEGGRKTHDVLQMDFEKWPKGCFFVFGVKKWCGC